MDCPACLMHTRTHPKFTFPKVGVQATYLCQSQEMCDIFLKLEISEKWIY